MQKKEIKIILPLYLLFFILGIAIFKDYGIGIEENFQRASGFYWLRYLLQYTQLENLKTIVNLKFNEVYLLNPNLPRVFDNLAYGIVFDVPASLIEILLNFESNSSNIYLRHFLSFFIFLISSLCFTIILSKRFSNLYVTFFGTLVYFFSPKIFGASFFDSKDVFFLSLFTITIFLYQNYELRKKIFNLLIFSTFVALLSSSRPPGFMVVISFIFFYFLEILCNINIKKNLYTILIFSITYLIILFVHWPYLWTLNLNFSNSYGYVDHKIFFDGEFYLQKNLPINYIPKWILISTPLFIIFFFIFGLIFFLNRLYFRLVNIKQNKEKKYKFDFWRGKKEGFDIFIFLCFLQTIFIYYTFNDQIFSSWRHFYFIHFFLIYYFSFFLNIVFLYLKKSKFFNIVLMLLIMLNLEMIYKLYLYHPFQNMYFNNLVTKNDKLNYERDTANLTRLDFIKNVLKYSTNENKKIKIGSASWSPLEDVLIFFDNKIKNKLELVTNINLEDADFIFTNYIYEVNIRYNKKYNIPKSFILLKSITKDDTLMYSIYKKK